MPVESDSIFDRPTLRDQIPGVSFVLGGTGRRPIWDTLWDLPYYLTFATDKLREVKPGTKEFTTERRYSRLRALYLVYSLGTRFLIPYGAWRWGGRKIGLSGLLDIVFNPEQVAIDQTVAEREVMKLSLLGGREGLDYLCGDIAIASLGINKDTYQTVDFNNPSTWGHSELRYQLQGLESFSRRARTSSGRDALRNKIAEMAHGNQTYIDARSAGLDRFETYIRERGLPPDIDVATLKAYFLSIGYTERDWQILVDLERMWTTQKAVPGLKERIENTCIQGQPESLRQRDEKLDVVERLLQRLGLEEHVDGETMVGLVETIPQPTSLPELQTVVGEHFWYPDHPQKTPYGVSSALIACCLLALMLNRSPNVFNWGLSQLEKLGRKYPQLDILKEAEK